MLRILATRSIGFHNRSIAPRLIHTCYYKFFTNTSHTNITMAGAALGDAPVAGKKHKVTVVGSGNW